MMDLIKLSILSLLISLACLCYIQKQDKNEAHQEISYLHLSETLQTNTAILLPLSLPTAGDARKCRPRIRRIGLSPSQYQMAPIKSDSSTMQEKISLENSQQMIFQEIPAPKEEKQLSKHQSAPELLYSAVQAEAGNQDLKGQRLVCDVILNRVSDPRFPATIEEVLYSPGQFSVVRNGALKKAQGNISPQVVQAVDMEMNGERLDSTVLYFNNKPNGGWRYGGHYFK